MFPSLVAIYEAHIRNHFLLAKGRDEFQRFGHSVYKAYSHWFQTETDILKLLENLRECQKATREIELKHARGQITLEVQMPTQMENDMLFKKTNSGDSKFAEG